MLLLFFLFKYELKVAYPTVRSLKQKYERPIKESTNLTGEGYEVI